MPTESPAPGPGAPEVRRIDALAARLDPGQAARHAGPDFDRLVESVRRHGLLQPPLVRPDLTVVAGTGRTLAWRRARPGQPMPVLVLAGAGANDLVLAGNENTARSAYTAPQLTALVGGLLAAGLTPQQIAADVPALDETEVSCHRTLLTRAGPELTEAYTAGKVEFTKAVLIARQDPDRQPAWLEATLGGLTRDELKRRVRKKARPPGGPKAGRCRLTLAGGTVTVVGAAPGADGLVEVLQAALDAARRAAREGLDPRTLERVVSAKQRGAARA